MNSQSCDYERDILVLLGRFELTWSYTLQRHSGATGEIRTLTHDADLIAVFIHVLIMNDLTRTL